MYPIVCSFLGLIFSVNILAHAGPSSDEAAPTQEELRIALRELWTGHVFWVRSVVVASYYKDEAASKAAETQAVANARRLADGIAPFYGQEAADRLFELLAGHYGAINGYLDATLSSDPAGKTKSSGVLAANARAIAEFLDSANPHLPKSAVLPLLLAHGGHHMRQIDLIDAGGFDQEAAIWEEMLGHVHQIADAMAAALSKQFPDKLTG